MSEIPRGAEDIPPRSLIKGIKLVIIIKDIKSNRQIREERIEWDDPEARKWLGKLTYHAVTQGYSVETLNANDYVIKE